MGVADHATARIDTGAHTGAHAATGYTGSPGSAAGSTPGDASHAIGDTPKQVRTKTQGNPLAAA